MKRKDKDVGQEKGDGLPVATQSSFTELYNFFYRVICLYQSVIYTFSKSNQLTGSVIPIHSSLDLTY